MILLDTNVISEWMKPAPDPRVVAWLDEQPPSHLFLCSVAKAEIETGIAWLPQGQRKTALSRAAQAIFDEFMSRCLPLDCQTTVEYAKVLSLSKCSGRPISVEDAQIAAVAYRHSMTLATRNVSDFDFLADLDLVNPWHEGAAN
jgi:toxin FitB